MLYPRHAGQRDDLSFVTRVPTGSLFAGSTSDYHAYTLAVHGYDEWRLWAIALAICRPGDVVVEIGAHIGTETVCYSDLVGPSGRVLAFEPLAANRRLLERNLTLFQYANVTVHPYALGDATGSVPFAAPPPSGSSGIGHVLGPQERDSQTVTYWGRPIKSAVENVEMRTLDSLVDDDVRLITMDAEGSELRILRGARGLIARSGAVIVLEANAWHQRRAGADLETLHAELRSLGYRVFEVTSLALAEITTPRTTAAVQTWVSVPESQLQLATLIAHMIRRCGLAPRVGTLNPLRAVPTSRRDLIAAAEARRHRPRMMIPALLGRQRRSRGPGTRKGTRPRRSSRPR